METVTFFRTWKNIKKKYTFSVYPANKKKRRKRDEIWLISVGELDLLSQDFRGELTKQG